MNKIEQKRKLQELGGSLYLSLPSEWTNNFKLKKGGEVIITSEESGELKIFPEKIKEEKEKSITINYDEDFFRDLIREYFQRKDIIRIKKNTPFSRAERNHIFAKVSRLLNLEIIEEESNQITLQNLKSDIPMKKMVARMYFLTKSMLDDLIKNPTDKEVLNSIIDRDDLVGKFYFAIIAQQREMLESKWSKELSLVEVQDLRLFIAFIELIGDEIKDLAKRLLDKEKINIKDLEFLSQKYELAYNTYIKQDTASAKNFWHQEKEDKKRLQHDEKLLRIYEFIKDITDLVI